MHINVTIGLLGFLGAAGRALQSFLHASAMGVQRTRLRWPAIDDVRADADLRDSLRALVHRGAPRAAGITHGWISRRWTGNGACAPSARRTGAATRAGTPSCPSRSRTEKDLATSQGAGCAAQGADSGRTGADGHQPSRRSGAALYVEAPARQSAVAAASAP